MVLEEDLEAALKAEEAAGEQFGEMTRQARVHPGQTGHEPKGNPNRKTLMRIAVEARPGRRRGGGVVSLFGGEGGLRAGERAVPSAVVPAIDADRTMQEMLACANEMAQRIAYDTREWTG